jgi:hypothetical protein
MRFASTALLVSASVLALIGTLVDSGQMSAREQQIVTGGQSGLPCESQIFTYNCRNDRNGGGQCTGTYAPGCGGNCGVACSVNADQESITDGGTYQTFTVGIDLDGCGTWMTGLSCTYIGGNIPCGCTGAGVSVGDCPKADVRDAAGCDHGVA